MKSIGIMTNDFRLFYDLAETLKSMGRQFTSLTFDGRVPPHIGIVLTSERELVDVFFEQKLAVGESVQASVRRALVLLAGCEPSDHLYIGVDPGETPGIATLFRGRVLETAMARSPEDAAARVLEMYDGYGIEGTVVRIGHGDADNRNRIIQLLCGKVERCEIVDETTTSSPSTTDMDSAIAIARTRGFEIEGKVAVRPRPGKLRDLQRKSRIHSNGTLTLSKEEVAAVAEGRTTMEEALRRRRRAPG
jgi:hypothetical protein